MEVDPPLLNNPNSHHSLPLDHPDSSSVSRHRSDQDRLQDNKPSSSAGEEFELNTEQVKRILSFGKELQSLYNSLTADTPNHKFKVLLQVNLIMLYDTV